MKDLLKLFTLLQLTKEQPLTGYLATGTRREDLPSIAEHLYTAALMGWFLVQKIKQAGGHINERKVIIMLLLCDIHNLFGGDISGPLSERYPDLADFKARIGERTTLLLSQFLDDQTSDLMEKLWLEMTTIRTDEAVVVDIIDQMDHQFFLEHRNHSQGASDEATASRADSFKAHIFPLTENIDDTHTKKVMEDFITNFYNDYFGKGYQGMRILLDA